MWLLEAKVREQIEQAIAAGATPTAEKQIEFEASRGTLSADSSRILTTAGNTAEIAVNGTLTKAPNFMAFLFGGGNTTYAEIVSALAEAEADPNVKDAVLAIDSPGGSIDGLFDALAAIQAFDKPLRAVVSNTAASAAFAIAAQADSISATNRAARFGSVGIAANFIVDESVVTITSTEAPNKRPDVTTEAGKAAVREELDALHEIFAEAIASGRNTTVDKVNSDFGQGATLLAGDALKRGMIDKIAKTSLTVVKTAKSTPAAKSGNEPEASKMDLNTLKAQHADVYQAAADEGRKDGVQKERDRVTAHLTMGEASGDMKTAMASISDGSEMTAALNATYMAAGMRRTDVNNRQDDDNNGGDGANAGDVAAQEAKMGDAILAGAAAACNVEMGA